MITVKSHLRKGRIVKSHVRKQSWVLKTVAKRKTKDPLSTSAKSKINEHTKSLRPPGYEAIPKKAKKVKSHSRKRSINFYNPDRLKQRNKI